MKIGIDIGGSHIGIGVVDENGRIIDKVETFIKDKSDIEEKIEKYLVDQKIAQELIGELRDFHMRYEVEDQVKERVEKPDILFYGKKILEMSIAALLQGDNLLLSGAKATGKNVLCETLAWIFGRPEYDISFHVNTDSADLIGTDTFINNEVRLRKGPIYQCAEFGGFGILDEINMAKNDAVSVLHATLDHRRRIDIPGYNRILLHPATRFIGTMNYGYAGTRELNEALVSRFMVIDMPEMDEDSVLFVLRQHFPDGEKKCIESFCRTVSGFADQSLSWRNLNKIS